MSAKRFAFHYLPLETNSSDLGVFGDPSRNRRKRLRRRVGLLFAFLCTWVGLFLSDLQPSSLDEGKQGFAFASTSIDPSGSLESLNADLGRGGQTAGRNQCSFQGQSPDEISERAHFPRVFAHLPATTGWAHLSLKKSCGAIGVLVPDWITIEETKDGFSVDLVSDDTRTPVKEYLKRAATVPEIMPRIQFDFNLEDLSTSEKISKLRAHEYLTSDLGYTLSSIKANGACFDLGQFPQDIREHALSFLHDLRRALEKDGFLTCIILSGTDIGWMDKLRVEGFDHVIVKLFFEPWVGSAPTPLSENGWFIETARRALAAVGPDRLVLALGTFGASWESGVPLPRPISYGEALSEVADAEVELIFNEGFSGSFAAFRNKNGNRQKIWLQDAASFFNQISMMKETGISNVGIWSLGQEDPGVWQLLGEGHDKVSLDGPSLTGVMIDNYVEYTGKGPVLRVQDRANFGFRTFERSLETGLISRQVYEVYPEPYRLERFGEPAPGEIVLTFDDGPHPVFTPQVLDILKETGTPATFFVLGQNVISHPAVLKRVMKEGHEIGAHSFSHPRMDKISGSRTHFEHTLTDRAIASVTGRTTQLYREPFLRSGGPISAGRVEPLIHVQSRGKINYGMDVVPKDWLGLTSNEIAAYVIEQVVAGAGNVILLHDGGGKDRSASVEALPVIISELRARGYRFRSIADVLEVDKSALMPSASTIMPQLDRISFAFASGTINGLVLLFWFVLLIGLCRSLVIFVLAALRGRHQVVLNGSYPKVAVVIPAFNEEAAIAKCIESVLASDYPWLEIVVVDDGSSDKTLSKILEFKHYANVRLISHPNQGKWSALNRAILTLESDVAVCIDADTQVARDAVSKLATHFQDPKIGAVAGKIVVGNPINLLTRMQALEYVTAQNFERRAFDHINGIMVVPGAIGAWRVTALHKGGLFCSDTMTEDCDLTISVNRAGYRIVYDECAVAYTEAPQSIRALLTQRLRWSLGMFQSAWKHKRAVVEARSVGFASIPDMLVFGYLFPLLAPIADLFVLILAYNLIAGSWTGEIGEGIPLVSPGMIWAYIALPALEFLIAAYAVMSDPTAKKGLILYWPIQRIFYRPILYLTVFRALVRAISGTLADWGKSKRHGNDLLKLERA